MGARKKNQKKNPKKPNQLRRRLTKAKERRGTRNPPAPLGNSRRGAARKGEGEKKKSPNLRQRIGPRGGSGIAAGPALAGV